LFDALRFLSRLSGEPLLEAAQAARGDLLELFHVDSEGHRVDRMHFAVEMSLNASVTDDFGNTRRLPATRIRYELALELRESRTGLRPFVAETGVRVMA
jgi:hypothetical protein